MLLHLSLIQAMSSVHTRDVQCSICVEDLFQTDLPEAAALRLRDVLGSRMHRWLVSWRRMRKRKLSALIPLVPFSKANGGAQPGGGTIQQIPALHVTHQCCTGQANLLGHTTSDQHPS